MAILEKKALATWKNKHALHVLLIIDQEGCNKVVAEAQAYHEGVEGLAVRQHVTEPMLPLREATPPAPPPVDPKK